jgi:hypothetical protein
LATSSAKPRPAATGHEGKAVALHEVAADHHQQPARGDGEFAEAAALQLERRRRVGPAHHQAGKPDQDQFRAAHRGEPEPGRDHGGEQRIAEDAGGAQREHAVLDEAAAAGEGELPLGVGAVAARDRVVVVVDHVGAGMGDQGEEQRRGGQRGAEGNARIRGGGQAEQAADEGDGKEGRPRRGEVTQEGIGQRVECGFQRFAHLSCPWLNRLI